MSRLFFSFKFLSLLLVAVGSFFIFSHPENIRANSAPTVDTVTASASSLGSETALTLTEGTTTPVYIHGSITDTDGCNDIALGGTITGKFFRTDVSGGAGCSSDSTNCYTISNAQCVQSGCSGDGDNTLDYQCSIPIQYYADSTTVGPHTATNWTASITATDASSATGSSTGAIEMNSTVALDVTPSISYGTIDLNNESSEQTITVTNTGNTGIDINLSANGPMACDSGSINEGSVHYYGTPGTAYSSGTPLATTPAEFELNLAPQTQDGVPQTKNLYLKLKIPTTGAGGSCSNTLTTTATADTENGW